MHSGLRISRERDRLYRQSVMGQCWSHSAPSDAQERPPHTAPQEEPKQRNVVKRELHAPIIAPNGVLHVVVSQACFGGATLGGDPTPVLLVRQTAGGHTFIALFEGLGEDKRAVATFCRDRAFEAFQESSVHHPDSPLDALKATVERLEAAIFATDVLKHSTKASSGAACVLLLLEHGGQRVYCANVGAAHCLLSRIAGSFNAKQPEGFFLSAEHTTSNREELVRLHRRAGGESTPPTGTPREGEGGCGLAGDLTRALGFTQAKRQAGGSGALVCDAFVTDHALTGPDQHLVLASSAFWKLVGPTDCALRAHFHEKFARRELEHEQAAAAAAAAAGGPGPEAPTPSLLRAANTAEHLVHWALEKAARRLAILRCPAAGVSVDENDGDSVITSLNKPALPPSVADVMALPAALPTPGQGGPAHSAGTAGQEDAGAAPETQIIKGDVHGDLGVIVVTLRRQDQSMDSGMRHALMAAAAARTGASGAGSGQESDIGYLERGAARRWAQIRMLVDFHKAHRRVLLNRWWDAQDALFRRSRVAAAATKPLLDAAASPGQLAAAAASQVAARQGQPGATSPSPTKAASKAGALGSQARSSGRSSRLSASPSLGKVRASVSSTAAAASPTKPAGGKTAVVASSAAASTGGKTNSVRRSTDSLSSSEAAGAGVGGNGRSPLPSVPTFSKSPSRAAGATANVRLASSTPPSSKAVAAAERASEGGGKGTGVAVKRTASTTSGSGKSAGKAAFK